MRQTLHSKCKALVKSAGAAHLLAHFVMLQKKAKHQFEGKTWVIFTREKTCDATSLTRHEYNTALSKLKALEGFEVRHGGNPFNGRSTSTWVHISDTLLSMLADSQLSASTDFSLYNNKEKRKKKIIAIASHIAHDPTGVKTPEGDSKEMKKATDEKRPGLKKVPSPSVEAIQKAVQEAAPVKPLFKAHVPKHKQTANLEVWWKSLLGQKFGFQPSWTGKEHGMIAALLSDISVDKFMEAVEYAVPRWDEFRGFVAGGGYWSNPPISPTIGFIYQTRKSLMDFMNTQSIAQKPEPQTNPLEIKKASGMKSPSDIFKK